MTGVLKILLVVAGAVAAYLATRKDQTKLVVLYAFLVPWFGLQANFGLTLSTDRVVAVMLILGVLAHRGMRGFRGFGLFYIFIVLNTVAQSISLPSSAKDYPPLQGEWRWVFQLAMWMLLLAPGAIVAATEERTTIKVYEALVWAATILGALAIIQFVTFYAVGVDLFPITIFTDAETQRMGIIRTDSFLGGTVFRACALGGEPKHLGYGMVVSLGILSTDAAMGPLLTLSRRVKLFAAAIQAVALVVTFSSQSYSLLVANTVALMGMAAIARGVGRGQRRLMVAIAVVVAIAFLVPGLGDVLRQRTIERFDEAGVVEDWTLAVWDFLADNPWAIPLGVGLGNVHLWAAPYIGSEFARYMSGAVFVAKAGALRILSEAGIVGLVIWVFTFLPPVRSLWRRARIRGSVTGAHAAIALAVVTDFMITADGPTFVYLIVGCAIAAARTARVPGQADVSQLASVTD